MRAEAHEFPLVREAEPRQLFDGEDVEEPGLDVLEELGVGRPALGVVGIVAFSALVDEAPGDRELVGRRPGVEGGGRVDSRKELRRDRLILL